ncbi:MAG: IS481 family transposase [Firmicutes bacterium]|nr:IS481 family transposase [Bacillota bacterium]
MTAKEKVAQRKLSMLQLAAELGNVSKACKIMGYSRSQFYEIKRAFQTGGLEALLDRPSIPVSVPHKVAEEIEAKVIDLSIEHPAWGQMRVRDEMIMRGVVLGATTVRNIWVRNDLETRYKRMLELEKRSAKKGFALTEEQIKLLEKHNPEFAERHIETLYPGYLLSQDTFYVGTLKGVGRLYMQAVVDTYSSFAFAKLYTAKIAITAADIVFDRVLPFFAGEGIVVNAMLTDNGKEYKGRLDEHPYELLLSLHDIEHRFTRVGTPRTNGFVERFHRTVLDEFFREAFRKKSYASVDELQIDLDAWLKHYNYERPHRGYRNLGRKPYETFSKGKKEVDKGKKADDDKEVKKVA